MKYIKQSLRSKPKINDIIIKIYKLECEIAVESRRYLNYTFSTQYPWELDHTNSYKYIVEQMIANHKKLIRLQTVLAVLEGKICI